MAQNEMDKIMAEFDDIFPKRDSVLYNTSKSYQDEVDRQDKIEREKISIKLQVDLTKRVQNLESTLQKQREIEHIQRQEERKSDRWFAAKTLIIAAILGALLTKFFDFIFR